MGPYGFDIVVVALVALVILTIALGVRTVPQGYNYTVERFGRYSRTLGAGLGLIVPYIDRVGHKVNVMEQVLDIPSQEAITKDNAGVRIDAAAFFQVLDAAKARYEVASLDDALMVLTMTNIRTVVGSMDLDQLLSHRDEINERLLRVMDAAASPWGVKVTRIEIRDILPPADIAGAMNRQMKAEREKRAQILESEGLREAAILKAQGERQADILKAEGEKQAVVLAAEGKKEAAFREAEARERAAQAEAEATRMVSQAIAAGDVQAINYFVANNYMKALEQIARSPNQKVLMMPLEAASVIGSIAGIAEIAGAAFGNREGAPPRPTGGRPNSGSVPRAGA